MLNQRTRLDFLFLTENELKFDASFPHAEDYDFFTRMAKVSQLHNVQQSLYKIRHHRESVSKKFSDVQETCSNNVKRALFKTIGIKVSNDDLNLYREFMHQNYEMFKDKRLIRILELTSSLIEANKQSCYLPQEYLRNELAERVLHLFNQKSGSEKGLVKLLRTFKHFKFSDNPKLFLTTYGKVLMS